jgi:hypothetical protein
MSQSPRLPIILHQIKEAHMPHQPTTKPHNTSSKHMLKPDWSVKLSKKESQGSNQT